MTVDDIISGLQTKFLGHHVYVYQSIQSTNDVALHLGANGVNGVPDGTLVMAEYQTAGRGRLGKNWLSPPNCNILVSVILRPKIQLYKMPIVTLLTSAAVVNSIRFLTSLPAKIKWPNDVLIDGKKVCGILTEASVTKEHEMFLVVGIGINVNIAQDSFPISLKSTATSLSILLGYEISRRQLLQQFLLEFEKRYILLNRGELTPIISEVKRLSSILGCQVRVECDENVVVGQAVDIDEDGALILRTRTGTLERFMAGSVTLF